MARLQADVEGRGVERADVVIEAIFENADAKRELYARIEPRLKAGAILATNTSSLMLEPLADRTRGTRAGSSACTSSTRSRRCRWSRSSSRRVTEPQARAAALAFTRAIDKLPLPCRSAPGFLVNRVLMPYMTEAMLAAGEGVPLATIDAVAVQFGMPMGPDRTRGHRRPRRLPARRAHPVGGLRRTRARRGRAAGRSRQARQEDRARASTSGATASR